MKDFLKRTWYYILFKLSLARIPEGTKCLTATMSFEKESNGCWYAVIPEWPGLHGALQMVAGADDVLEMLSGGRNFVTLNISNDHEIYEIWNRRGLVYVATHSSGGNYLVHQLHKNIWLCSVAEWVFGGHYPEEIYFTVKHD